MSFRPGALKSLSTPAAVATLLSLANDGSTSAVTGQTSRIIDLQDTNGGGLSVGASDRYGIDGYHEGLFRIVAKTVNGQGGTPTAPGASKSYTLYYAFLHELVALADAPTVLQNIDSSLTLNLPNNNSAAAAGTRYHASDNFVIGGRYLYVWYDRSAFDANALVDVTAILQRL